MKKVLVIILVMVCITALLFGCAKNTEDSWLSESTGTTKLQEAISPSPASTIVPQNVSIAKWEGNTFVSEWAEFSIPMPSGWYKASDEEIKEIYSIGTDIISGLGAQELADLENANYVYPMMIMKYTPGIYFDGINTNIIVFYEKLLPPNNVLVGGKSYLEITKKQYIDLNIGYEINEDIIDIKVAGAKFFTMTAELKEAGMKQIFLCRKHDNFIIGIIITAGIENQSEIDALINSISNY